MAASITKYSDIPGWFYWFDHLMFQNLLANQSEHGDLVELGAYLGRSAVVIAEYQRPGERLVVVDLFGDEEKLGDDPRDAANRAENQGSYRSLTRQAFEANYLALHPELPVVVQGLSSEIVDHVAPGSVRFMHVDASHLYDPVREDVQNSRTVLQPNGIVVFDDFRSAHTPGVAAAVWEAVVNDGLRPFAITGSKMYGTWGDPTQWLDVTRSLVASDNRLWLKEQTFKGNELLVISSAPEKPAPPPAPLTDADVRKIAERVADIVDAKQQARAKARAQARAKAQPNRSLRARAKRYLKRKLG